MKDFIEIKKLQQLHRVEAPEYLLMQINDRIRSRKVERAPLRWSIAASLAFLCALTLNLYVLDSRQDSTRKSTIKMTIENLGLMPSNQLYHE